eukprot:scaffold52115_cov48-Phaeocystis_antarctica.AAC.2
MGLGGGGCGHSGSHGPALAGARAAAAWRKRVSGGVAAPGSRSRSGGTRQYSRSGGPGMTSAAAPRPAPGAVSCESSSSRCTYIT